MRVTLVLPLLLREHAGGRQRLEVEPGEATLAGVLDVVAARHPALERRLRDESRGLRRHVNFYLDGEECRWLDGAGSEVRDGTEVRVIPSVAGG
ncbi:MULTISPECIES: MoaD/ThiS family protein [Saccharopolyspora]|uniref:MoaD/ThiS family protein n=1 Tax=Saccharopolyspora TaxID=1835 RepID=UPI001CD3DDBB|nr:MULTISPECIES: MoaD/ThiS family protein [Saccharopolyspora]MCA1187437.1 MoaD/ThiS family protein [Saccharopolyspora sp. 6T]MCA1192510.1 MoaD/ThiS family protein [Saccharopolyspora sp. 6V]MCA1224450.1 MoaD/ThiS family protein [Saccharopolyspora sp. 6M]MCA1281329.1 MoaD/ThiS family protein [Saccharopolyspora sp. 7B]